MDSSFWRHEHPEEQPKGDCLKVSARGICISTMRIEIAIDWSSQHCSEVDPTRMLVRYDPPRRTVAKVPRVDVTGLPGKKTSKTPFQLLGLRTSLGGARHGASRWKLQTSGFRVFDFFKRAFGRLVKGLRAVCTCFCILIGVHRVLTRVFINGWHRACLCLDPVCGEHNTMGHPKPRTLT